MEEKTENTSLPSSSVKYSLPSTLPCKYCRLHGVFKLQSKYGLAFQISIPDIPHQECLVRAWLENKRLLAKVPGPEKQEGSGRKRPVVGVFQVQMRCLTHLTSTVYPQDHVMLSCLNNLGCIPHYADRSYSGFPWSESCCRHGCVTLQCSVFQISSSFDILWEVKACLVQCGKFSLLAAWLDVCMVPQSRTKVALTVHPSFCSSVQTGSGRLGGGTHADRCMLNYRAP